MIIDTEEEFDWSKPLARENTEVRSIEAQHRAQEIFTRFDVVPTYVVDYPVAASDAAVRHLAAFHDAGACEIGAHLHPWVNPPHEEAVTPANSYAGNLPAALEREKLTVLTDTIARAFGRRPVTYKAGRYGVGPNTGAILEDLGYAVDASVVPYTAFTDDGGPDFRAYGPEPYWFGRDRRMLALPLTVGFAGSLAAAGPSLYPVLSGRLGMACHAPGVFARLGLVERIRLSPEGIDGASLRRLARSLIGRGQRVFSLTYHSSSLMPGGSPYVRDAGDLKHFLETIAAFLRVFRDELGGRPTTPWALYEEACADRG